MKRIIMMLTVAAMMVTALTITSAGAFAATPEQKCESTEGAEFTRTNGTASCEYDPVVVDGKSPNPKFQKSTTLTETGQGNLDNKDADSNPETCSKPCPPGQFN